MAQTYTHRVVKGTEELWSDEFPDGSLANFPPEMVDNTNLTEPVLLYIDDTCIGTQAPVGYFETQKLMADAAALKAKDQEEQK